MGNVYLLFKQLNLQAKLNWKLQYACAKYAFVGPEMQKEPQVGNLSAIQLGFGSAVKMHAYISS